MGGTAQPAPHVLRTAAVAEALILATIAAAPWPYGSATDVARYAVTAVLLVALAIWALDLARAGKALPCLIGPAVALPAFAAVQVILGRSAAPIFTLEAALVLGAMTGVAAFWSDRGRIGGAAPRLVIVVLATCAAQAIFGAVQWSVHPTRIYGNATEYVTMPFGSYVNHNHFAGLMGMGAVLAAGLAVAYAGARRSVSPAALASGGAALGLVAVHLASRSRGGLVALLGGLTALGALWLVAGHATGKRRRIAGVVAAGLVVLVLAFGWAAIPADSRRHLATAFSGSVDGSGAYRIDVAAATLRAFSDRPLLGWGVGAFEDAIPPYKRAHGDVRVRHAESDALELLAEGGIALLVLVAWMLFLVLRGLRDRVTTSRDRFRNALALAAAGSAATLLVHSLIDFNLRLPANALVFSALAGLAAAPRTDAGSFGGRSLSTAIGAGWFVLAVAAGWRTAGAVAEESGLRTRNPVQRVAVLTPAVSSHPYAAGMFRARAQAWRDLAWRPPAWDPLRLLRAENDLRRALDLRPRWGEAWADLAWLRAFQGDATNARDAMLKASALDPTHLGVGLATADLLWRQGDIDGAIDRLRRLKGVHPGWTPERARAIASQWTRDQRVLERVAAP